MRESRRQDRQSLFYYLLLIILLIHTGLLFLKFYPEIKQLDQEKVLKVLLNPDSRTKKQIVQSEDTENREKKDNAYLSDKDRSFDRQTKARKVDTFKKATKSQSSPKPKTPKNMKLSDLGANVGEPHPLAKAAQDYTKKKNGDGADNSPNREVSSTNDHVEDVALGDATNLNTVEYQYYGFYHRVRQKLEQFWGRSIHEKAQQLIKDGRQVASSEEFVTSLQITLNHLGEIIEIKLRGSSGLKELDDAAIESFNQAGPFPNPPKGLIKNGLVVIEWGFVVNT